MIVSADDLGLTRHNTDTILEAADSGALTSVSVLANGEALEYALAEYAKRKDALLLSAHLNLTEGKPVSPAADIPLLVDERGFFNCSPGRLWLRFLCSSPKKRKALKEQVAHELSAQWGLLRARATAHGADLARADGHQHVHMVPFVFDEVLLLPGLKHIRMVREPWYVANLSFGFLKNSLGCVALGSFARRNALRTKAQGIETNKYFLGVRYSGAMTLSAVEAGLQSIAALPAGETEILFHPGEALPSELAEWKESGANVAWHYSSWRARERGLLGSPMLGELLRSPKKDLETQSTFSTLVRFGISGSVSVLINLFILYALVSWFNVWYVLAAAAAYFVGIFVSFSSQKFWTFGGEQEHTTPRQIILYLLLQTCEIAVGTVGIYVLVQYTHIWYLLAQVLLLATLSVLSFIVFRHIIFKKSV